LRGGAAGTRARALATAARSGIGDRSRTIIEIFEWVSQDAIAGAHANPAVLDLWKQFEAVCTYEVPSNIAEFQNMFAHFASV
jgi:hypothetical protein